MNPRPDFRAGPWHRTGRLWPATIGLCLTLGVIPPAGGQSQRRIPSVDKIFERFDADGDSFLSEEEVAGSGIGRNFGRLDRDGDAKASKEEVIAAHRKAGFAADGSPLQPAAPAGLDVPEVAALFRADRTNRPDRETARESAWVLRLGQHPVAADGYLILTDLQDEVSLAALDKLAAARDGDVWKVPDLGDRDGHADLQQRLKENPPRFLAIAPAPASYRENTLLGLWQVAASLDDDPQLDVYPGLLLASDPGALDALVERTLNYTAPPSGALDAFLISQVASARELRSLQKAALLRNHFDSTGGQATVLAVYRPRAVREKAFRLPGSEALSVDEADGKALAAIPAPVVDAFTRAPLLVMHGHGIPGMSCSIDVDALESVAPPPVVLSGSCFSAAPWESDLPAMREAPGGYEVTRRDAFSVRAVDRGAVVSFGHMRLSAGFPHLFPLLESLLAGGTVGESYQQLLNALSAYSGIPPEGFVVESDLENPRRIRQNALLYVLIGDPALRPFAGTPSL